MNCASTGRFGLNGQSGLKTAPIHLLDFERRQIHVFQTAHIDAEHFNPVVRASAHRRSAADRAEVVFDFFPAELVGGEIAFRCDESNLCTRNKLAQYAQPPAYGAVAFFYATQIPFDFKSDVTTMTATLVKHDESS